MSIQRFILLPPCMPQPIPPPVKAEAPVVMISGLEYLIVQNNYHSALKFLQLVRDQIAIYDSLLIATISPSPLTEKDLKLIEREMEPLHQGGG